MKLKIYPDYKALSQAAGNRLVSIVRHKPDARLIFAMGNTPQGTYRDIARRVQAGEISFKDVHVFQLDEYLGVTMNDRRSFYGWLMHSCIEPMEIPVSQVIRLPGDAAHPQTACRQFAAQLTAAGGIDVAILGLGSNGHVGFNEPGSDCNVPTRVVELTPDSIASNAAYWGSQEDVPHKALTIGLDALLRAQQILLLVSGVHKAKILAQVMNGPLTTNVPATCLRLAADVMVMADASAAQYIE